MLSLTDAIRPTTFIESTKLRDHLGLDVIIAAETFQHTGSFKFRAAYNVAANVPNEQILTASSGNFGQAMAYACRLLDKKCTVVMPETSALVKVDAVRSYGAVADLIDVTTTGRTERVAHLAESMPTAYVASAYDDEWVIEGNATLGDEIAAKDFEAVIAPIGGGGLISGILTGLCRSGSRTMVYGAEPQAGNDAARSFRQGELIANTTEPMTIADGARTISLGKLNWPIIRDGVKDIFEVPDDRLANATRLYFDLANLKVEPTAALSLACLLTEAKQFQGMKICVVASGGNVDPGVYAALIAQR